MRLFPPHFLAFVDGCCLFVCLHLRHRSAMLGDQVHSAGVAVLVPDHLTVSCDFVDGHLCSSQRVCLDAEDSDIQGDQSG